MRIVVVNAYRRENAGDAALEASLLAQLAATFPGADLVVAGMEDPAVDPSFEGVPNIGSIRRASADEHASRAHRMWHKAVAAVIAAVPHPERARWLRRVTAPEVFAQVDAIAQADLVVSLGGGYLTAPGTVSGTINIATQLLPIHLAHKLGKPVVFAPQSIGPFGTARQGALVARVLARTDLVLIREEVSMELLERLGVPPTVLQRGVDSAFTFTADRPTPWRRELGFADHDVVTGITARQWLEPAGQERFERALAATADRGSARGHQVLLVPHCTSPFGRGADDDRVSERRIRAFATSDHVMLLDRVIDYRDLKVLYGEIDQLIGTRFHSVIFALTAMTPCIAIEYEHKTGGIMRDLGLGSWVVPIEQVTTTRLTDLFDRLLAEHGEYRDHLEQVIPRYLARAHDAPEAMRAAYARRLAAERDAPELDRIPS